MGSLCDNEEKITEPEVSKKRNERSEEKNVDEVKQFLSLTTKNTSTCFQRQDSVENESEKIHIKKCISDFKIVQGLGRGNFGKVFQVCDQKTKKNYALKIIKKSKIKNQQDLLHTLSERFILEALDHPFVVKLHYAFQTQTKLYLLVDLMIGGELFYLLRRNKKFPQNIAKFYAAEILLALGYLHKNNIIYRDLKPENTLISKDGHIKLADFGLSKVCVKKNELTYSMCGTPQYIAPQILSGKGYNHSADWYSFGSLLYDMLTGHPPFSSNDRSQMMKNKKTQKIQIPDQLSKEAKSLLKQLFQEQPKKRIGYKRDAQEIKKHAFFKQINFDLLQKKQVKPPLTFSSSQINLDGFEEQFVNQKLSYDLNDRSYPSNSMRYEGFTYEKYEDTFKPYFQQEEQKCM